jgi:hypothetical protein
VKYDKLVVFVSGCTEQVELVSVQVKYASDPGPI